MTTSRTIDGAAADKNGMTLAELRQFITECDKSGAAEITRIKATTTWGGHLKTLRAVAVRFGDTEES